MPAISYPLMHNHSFQLILIVLLRMLPFLPSIRLFTHLLLRTLLFLLRLLPLDPFFSIRLHVQIRRELTEIIHLLFLHRLEVKLEPLQHKYQVLGESLDALSPQSRHLLIAFLTMHTVIPIHHLSLDKRLQTLQDRLLVQHLQTDGQVRLGSD